MACFHNAAAHLAPGGCFVIEVGCPSCAGCRPARTSCRSRVSDDGLGFDRYDVVTQELSSNYIVTDGRGASARSRSATCGRPSWT